MSLALLLALGWLMPAGDFLGEPGAEFTHLKIGPERALRVTLRSGGHAEGIYHVTLSKGASWHVDLRVEEQAGPFKAGVKNALTLQFECTRGREQVQLCLHRAGAPLCEVLVSARRCSPPPHHLEGPPPPPINAPYLPPDTSPQGRASPDDL